MYGALTVSILPGIESIDEIHKISLNLDYSYEVLLFYETTLYTYIKLSPCQLMY